MPRTETLINGSVVTSYHGKEVATLIRNELKQKFPGVKFSIRTSRGVDSIDVSYSDGPTENYLKSILSKYKSGYFDGMTDSYKFREDRTREMIGLGNVRASVMYLGISRDYLTPCINALATLLNVPRESITPGEWHWYYRKLSTPDGTEYLALAPHSLTEYGREHQSYQVFGQVTRPCDGLTPFTIVPEDKRETMPDQFSHDTPDVYTIIKLTTCTYGRGITRAQRESRE